jgi:hypothetical protein
MPLMASAVASVIPSPYVICHIKRVMSEEIDAVTGNNVIVAEAPVVRRAQSISQVGRLRGSSHQVLTAEYLKRIETELHIAVADPHEYSPLDQVLLFPEVDEDGDCVPGTGYAFWVDGLPMDSRQSPWPFCTKAFGGLVRLPRVT